MHYLNSKILRVVWVVWLVAACNTADVSTGDGNVISIADGDTFTLLAADNTHVKVRLYGIDCPEKAQDFGQVARQGLSTLIFGQTIRLDKKDIDRYGRTVAIVYTNKGINVNEEMLREGLAWHYKQYDHNKTWDAFESEARQKKKGLWAQPNPTPPWLWRKAKREATPKNKMGF